MSTTLRWSYRRHAGHIGWDIARTERFVDVDDTKIWLGIRTRTISQAPVLLLGGAGILARGTRAREPGACLDNAAVGPPRFCCLRSDRGRISANDWTCGGPVPSSGGTSAIELTTRVGWVRGSRARSSPYLPVRVRFASSRARSAPLMSDPMSSPTVVAALASNPTEASTCSKNSAAGLSTTYASRPAADSIAARNGPTSSESRSARVH
jgi:hypothetical protein